MNQPITLYLIGIAGVGKYSIAKEIAKNNYKIVDNHLINNPIFSLIDRDDHHPIPRSVWDAVDRLREIIFNFITEDRHSNFVITNELLETDHDRKVYNMVKDVAEKRGSLFVPVRITVSQAEHAKRITRPARRERLKLTNVEHTKYHDQLIKIQHENLLHLDTSNFTAAQAATHIKSFIAALDCNQKRLVS